MGSVLERLKIITNGVQERMVDRVKHHPIFIKELTPENRARAEYIEYLLRKYPQLVLVEVSNHGSDNDGPGAVQATYRLMPKGMDIVYVMVASGRFNESPAFKHLVNAGNVFNTNPLPVVQAKNFSVLNKRERAIMRDQDEIAQERRRLQQSLKVSRGQLQDLRAGDTRWALSMFPEGTRRPNRVLKPPEKNVAFKDMGSGINYTLDTLAPVLVAPVALYPDNPNKTKKTSFGPYRLNAEIGYPMIGLPGSPVTYYDIMIQLARLLPEMYRGEWQPLLEEWENPHHIGMHG